MQINVIGICFKIYICFICEIEKLYTYICFCDYAIIGSYVAA